MNTINTISNQSIIDLAVKLYGSPKGVVQLLQDNPGIGDFTTDIPAGFALRYDADLTGSYDEVFVEVAWSEKERQTVFEVVVSEGQNVVDLALQEYGSAEGLIALVKNNGLAPDADLAAGNKLSIDKAEVVNERIEKLLGRVNTGDLLNDGIFDFTFDFTFE